MTAPRNTPLAAKRRDTTPKRKIGASRGDAAGARKATNTITNATAALVDPNKPLTDKQRAFVKFWASGESIHSASAKAGYADGGTLAYRMVHMPNVLKLYNEERARYEQVTGMTFQKVVDMHLEAFEMAKLMAEPGAMVAAAREVGKMHGYYAPVEKKITITGNKALDRINALSDEDLLKLLEDEGDAPLTMIEDMSGSPTTQGEDE